MGREIHIVQGGATGGCLRQALGPAVIDIVIHDDVLSDGPLRPMTSLQTWHQDRRAFWRSLDLGDLEAALGDGLGDWVGDVSRFRDSQSICVWVGMGAAEQLLLAWVPQLMRFAGADPGAIRVVQFARVTELAMDVWGLGLLSPANLSDHPPRERIAASALLDLENAWAAVTAQDPSLLIAFLDEDCSPLPHLRPAIRALLPRFPHCVSGINRWDSELLKHVQERGPQLIRVIGYTLGYNFDADLVSEWYLLSRIRRLADPVLKYPLLVLSEDRASMRETRVSLTDVGRAVVAGEANFVNLNGIDDWVLGVHLESEAGSVWYWNGSSLEPG